MNASPARQVRWLVVLTLAMLPALPLTAVDWAPLRFLVGTWEGVGQGAALQGRGTVTFGFELGEGVLIRRNRTEIAARQGKPAQLHEDLLIIYPAVDGRDFAAIYFDNEGHTIHYELELLDGGRRIVLVSAIVASQPRFRFTYERRPDGTLDNRFEFAPPNSPDDFHVYLEGTIRRK